MFFRRLVKMPSDSTPVLRSDVTATKRCAKWRLGVKHRVVLKAFSKCTYKRVGTFACA